MRNFIYIDNIKDFQEKNNDIFSIIISKNIKTKDELLLELHNKLQFPNYFGFNWDALLECLCDFNWVKQEKINILHHDLPNLNDKELYLYLDILEESIKNWKTYDGPFKKYELNVIFPLKAKQKIDELFEKYS